MRLKNKPIELKGPNETIKIHRNPDGIPVITAQNLPGYGGF